MRRRITAPALFALTRRKYHGLAARPGTFSLDSSLPFRSHQKKAGGAVPLGAWLAMSLQNRDVGLAVVLIVQVIIMVLFAYFIVFPALGRDFDADLPFDVSIPVRRSPKLE